MTSEATTLLEQLHEVRRRIRATCVQAGQGIDDAAASQQFLNTIEAYFG
jgi:hypothetical protein